MKVVYIAGPFRAPNAWLVECNIRKAEAMALAVAEAGAMPLCPHTNTRFFNGTCTDTFWIAGTLELLRRCDAIIMVQGWEKSSGARGERDVAQALDLPVFEPDEVLKLQQWLESVP